MFKKIGLILVLWCFSQMALSQETPIQPGDVLKVSVYGNPDLTTETEVSSTGFINLPLLGAIEIAHLISSQASEKIEQRLIDQKVLKNPQVIIVVLESKTNTVSVLGQVKAPGKYKINAGSRTLVDFIAIAGGLNPNASKDITIIKADLPSPANKITLNMEQIFVDGETNVLTMKNALLQSGDIIYVPEAPVFYIYGKVNRPGSFLLKRKMTVAQAIALGGGISSAGTTRGLSIRRKSKGDKFIDIKVNENTLIQANDTLYINESIF